MTKNVNLISLCSDQLDCILILTIFHPDKNFNPTNYLSGMKLSKELVLAFWKREKSDNDMDKEKLLF